jgi:hypothetical protein
MKFQAGDEVIVISPNGTFKSPEGCSFVQSMSRYIGQRLTIREWQDSDSYQGYSDPIIQSGTHYKCEETSWTWWEKWLKLAKPREYFDQELFEI